VTYGLLLGKRVLLRAVSPAQQTRAQQAVSHSGMLMFDIVYKLKCVCVCVCVCVLPAAPVFRQVSDGPHNMNVTEGDTVTINCNAYAEPQASIQWFQNGDPLDRKSLSAVRVFLVRLPRESD